MSTVEELNELLERLNQQHVILENPMINQLVDAYNAVGSNLIREIATAYKKVGEEERAKTRVYLNCPYVTDKNERRDVVFWIGHTYPEEMKVILMKEYEVPEKHARIIDYFLRRVWLEKETKSYEQVLKDIGILNEEPEEFWERRIRTSDQR